MGPIVSRSCIAVIAFATVGLPVSAQESSTAFGSVSGKPGEVVTVPVFASFPHPMRAVLFAIAYDEERLEYLGIEIAGTAIASIDPQALIYFDFGGGRADAGFNPARQSGRAFRVPPGEDLLLLRLLFRIRANAAVGEGPVVPIPRVEDTGTTTSFSLLVENVETGIIPVLQPGGGVTVLPPEGPRPVSDLSCQQVTDRIELMFAPTEPYDAIDVIRDGDTVASLPGDATEYSEIMPRTGLLGYSLVAYAGGASSVPIDCEVLADVPMAPAVENIVCSVEADGGGQLLTWTIPVDLDAIFIFRNGEQIAVLGGDAQSYTDADAGGDLAVYTLISELDGFRSPEATCVAHGVWMLEAGDVRVPADATRVRLPIYATAAVHFKGFDVFLDLDPDAFTVVQDEVLALDGTVAHVESEFALMGRGPHGGPAAGVIGDYFPPLNPEKNFPPGLRQPVFHFSFDVPEGRFADGDVVAVTFHGGSFASLDSRAIFPSVRLGAEIHFGSGGPAPVDNLIAQVAGGAAGDGGAAGVGVRSHDVRLSWRNADRYDTIRVLRNDVFVAELGGSLTEFVDPRVADGVFTYKVVSVRDGQSSFPGSAFLSTIAPIGAFLRADSNRDGMINVADPVATLGYLFLGERAPRCADAADADDDGSLTISDAVYTLNWLFNGGSRTIPSPGTRYPWFDPTPDSLGCAE